ncbi:MAG: DUF6702 family protein [Erythrobacter sp.]|jgi:hypothetical protein|nr:DUF6702 family protein [Erythrobacter sp.]
MRWLLVLLAALALALPASAHQQKAAISILSHNERTGMLEVVHRVPLHDAEHALKRRGIAAPDIIGDIPNRRAFVRYIAERFTVSHEGEKIAFTLLGSEIDGGSLVVYEEAPFPGPGARLKVRSLILTDVWARQENRVNIGSGTQVATLIFRAGDPAKDAMLR